MDFARQGWFLIGVLGVVMACGGATQPVCRVNTGTTEIDPAADNTVQARDGRATLFVPAGALATRCMAAIRVAAIDDRDLPHLAAHRQRVVFVPNSGVGISLQYADELRKPATLTLRFDAAALPGNTPPSDVRIASVVPGSCGAVEIGGPCTRDPTDKVTVWARTALESAGEVRIAISDSLSRTYALVVPQATTP